MRGGLIIVGTQLSGNSAILGPAIVFALFDMIVCMFVAVEIGRKAPAGAAAPARAITEEG